MDEYLCVTVESRAGESESEFSGRLSAFWTHLLRAFPDEFEQVYAETTEFEESAGRLSRQYLAGVDIIDVLERELTAKGLGFAPADRDELYSKYEATSPDWMQIEH